MLRALLASFVIYMIPSYSMAIDCEGLFDKNIVSEGKRWTWQYSSKYYTIGGESLLHPEHDSFTVIAKESDECLSSNKCDLSDLLCAVTSVLDHLQKRDLSIGRMQLSSYELYAYSRINTRDSICSEAYTDYYENIDSFWEYWIPKLNSEYEFKKIHARDIKLDKPEGIANDCFTDDSTKIPLPWSEIDYFPVITLTKIQNNK